jgi:hypothetical protein
MSMETIHLKLVDGMKKKLLPALADGTTIPNIVKDSLSLSIEPELARAGYCRLKMEVYIKTEYVKEALDNPKLFPGPIKQTF